MRHPFDMNECRRAGGESCGLKDLLTGKMVLSQGPKRAASRGRSASPHQRASSIRMHSRGVTLFWKLLQDLGGGRGRSSPAPRRQGPLKSCFRHRWQVWRKRPSQKAPQGPGRWAADCTQGCCSGHWEKPLAGQVSV